MVVLAGKKWDGFSAHFLIKNWTSHHLLDYILFSKSHLRFSADFIAFLQADIKL